MESTPATRRPKFLIALLLGLLAIAGGLWWGGRFLRKAPPSRFVSSQVPLLDLRLQFVDLEGEPLPASETRLGDELPVVSERPASGAEAASCPELVGGDTNDAFELPAGGRKAPDERCPRLARWVVKRHPVAFSVYVRDGKALLAFLENHAGARAVLTSELAQGLLRDPLQGAAMRGEDLNLEGVQGAFLQRLMREALQAKAELHYDLIHGRQGMVFSFVREQCPFAATALPLIAGRLARSGYRLPHLQEPVLELRLGMLRLFVAQHAGRVYLANGLEGLLNVLESLPEQPGAALPQAPLVALLRAEAFMPQTLPLLTGRPAWQAALGIGLSDEAPGELRLDNSLVTAHLRPAIFRGVLASIPRDLFAGVVTSLHLPPNMEPGDWLRLANQGPAAPASSGPEQAGVALLWDVSASQGGGLSQIGVVIANPDAPDLAERYRAYFAKEDLTASCAGGTVFLAASSSELLARMREGCAGQSLSVLDWPAAGGAPPLESSQLVCFFNPAVGLQQSFLAGGAEKGDLGQFEPQWKEQLEQAKSAMRNQAQAVFDRLPLLVYAGAAKAGGQEPVVLPARAIAGKGGAP